MNSGLARSNQQSEVSRLAAKDCLLAAVRTACQSSKSTKIEVQGAGHLWIDPGQGRFWGRIQDKHLFFRTPSKAALITHGDIPKQHKHGRPLEELLWDAAFIGSSGELFEHCGLNDLVGLNFWPNLTRVTHTEITFALCAFLSKRPSTMHLAFRALHVQEGDAFAFYNAGIETGCLRIIKARTANASAIKAVESENSRPSANEKLPFLARLFKRISRL